MTAPLAIIRDLSVRYGAVTALHPTSLDIAAGERIGIIGESGSGKSSFALALAGLLPAAATIAGRADWPGLPGPPVAGRDIGFVFQDPAGSLDPVMSVGRQLAEVCRQHLRLGRRAARLRAIELLDRVRLPDPVATARAYPHQLSGGQKQRVAIALAVASEPRLLVSDEATSALDTIVQAEIVALLERLVRDGGMTLLFVTHDLALASGLADRIAVFDAGYMVELGATATVLARPRHERTRSLLAAHVALGAAPGLVPA